MNLVSEDIKEHIEQMIPELEGFVFISTIPDNVGMCVALFDNGGSPPAYSTGNPLKTKYFQIRVKHHTYKEAHDLVNVLTELFEMQVNGIVGKTEYKIFRLNSEPDYMGRDNLGAYHWAVNLETDIQEN